MQPVGLISLVSQGMDRINSSLRQATANREGITFFFSTALYFLFFFIPNNVHFSFSINIIRSGLRLLQHLSQEGFEGVKGLGFFLHLFLRTALISTDPFFF
jgi:hypothetical protein